MALARHRKEEKAAKKRVQGAWKGAPGGHLAPKQPPPQPPYQQRSPQPLPHEQEGRGSVHGGRYGFAHDSLESTQPLGLPVRPLRRSRSTTDRGSSFVMHGATLGMNIDSSDGEYGAGEESNSSSDSSSNSSGGGSSSGDGGGGGSGSSDSDGDSSGSDATLGGRGRSWRRARRRYSGNFDGLDVTGSMLDLVKLGENAAIDGSTGGGAGVPAPPPLSHSVSQGAASPTLKQAPYRKAENRVAAAIKALWPPPNASAAKPKRLRRSSSQGSSGSGGGSAADLASAGHFPSWAHAVPPRPEHTRHHTDGGADVKLSRKARHRLAKQEQRQQRYFDGGEQAAFAAQATSRVAAAAAAAAAATAAPAAADADDDSALADPPAKQAVELSLSGLRVEAVPSTLAQLHDRLLVLDLSHNLLRTLPEALYRRGNGGGGRAALPVLEQLDLSHNHLEDLPEHVMHHFRRLRRLELGNNSISFLPPELGQLASLRYLGLANNSLTSLPAALRNLKAPAGRLRWVDVENNPMRQPPMEVCRRGLTARNGIFAYFKSLSRASIAVDRHARRVFLAEMDAVYIRRVLRLREECGAGAGPRHQTQESPQTPPSPQQQQQQHPSQQQSWASLAAQTGRRGSTGAPEVSAAAVAAAAVVAEREAVAAAARRQQQQQDPSCIAAAMATLCSECYDEAAGHLAKVGRGDADKQELELLAFFSSPELDPFGRRVPPNQQLQLMREIKQLQEAIPAAQQTVVPAARWPDDVKKQLAKVAPRVLQFSGHGVKDGHAGRLVFQSGDGLPSMPPLVDWVSLLQRDQADRLEGVLLNACETAGIAAALVRARTTEHLAAVCWATKVDNKASVTFTKGFYERMGTVVGCDIAEAFQAGVDAFTKKYNIGDPDA